MTGSGWKVGHQGLRSPQELLRAVGPGCRARWHSSTWPPHCVSFACPYVPSCFHPIPEVPIGLFLTHSSWQCQAETWQTRLWRGAGLQRCPANQLHWLSSPRGNTAVSPQNRSLYWATGHLSPWVSWLGGERYPPASGLWGFEKAKGDTCCLCGGARDAAGDVGERG